MDEDGSHKEPLNIDKSSLNEYQTTRKQMSEKNLEASGFPNFKNDDDEK